jgi:O-antigen/teichoic acid export membrane protein
MPSLNERIASLRQDDLLGRVLNNSAHLFSTNSLSLALSFLMGILSARLLGVAGFGLVGLVMSFASSVNSLLSFRMSELVVRHGGEYLERGEHQKAAALVKAAALAEAAVSMLAFLGVLLTSNLAAAYIAKTAGTAWMFSFFALGLLANFNYETSIGILQVTGQIKLQGRINLLQTSVAVLVITAGFLWGRGVFVVLLGYLIGKLILGLGIFLAAQAQLRRILGPGWWRTSLHALPSYREPLRFAVSSNISATLIKIFRESELLWVGFFLNKEAAGYYKAAFAIVGLLAVAADPLIATVYPEINRLIVQKAWPRLKDFLRKVTSLALAYNLLQALGFVLLGQWILWVYGKQYVNAYPALLVLLVGLAFNYTFFWNRPLLLSLNLPEIPIWVTLVVGLVKVGLAFVVVPRFGYVAEAALLSFYYLASVGLMAWRGIREVQDRSREAVT